MNEQEEHNRTELWSRIAILRREVQQLGKAAAKMALHETADYLDQTSNRLQNALDHVDD